MKQVFLESHNLKNKCSGFGQFNYHLIKGLYHAQPQDFELHICVEDKKELRDEFGGFFTYKRYNSMSRYPLFRISKKYDLWHAVNQNTKIEPRSAIPYLMTVHDIHFVEEQAPDGERAERFKDKLNRCDALVYISEFAKKDTHAHFDVPNVPEYVIHNGNPAINSELKLDASYRPKVVPPKPFLFTIGELTERKNAHTLIEMLAFLPDFHLVLAGNTKRNYFEKVQQTVQSLKLHDRVHILGKISEVDKKYYLENCAGFVFPSLREGFGIPPIEAMAYGKPIFISNNTSLPEIAGADAFYWDHYDPEYMAKIVSNGFENYEKDKEVLSEKYRAHAKKFDWNTTAQNYIDVYRSLLE